jgi:AraC-like DNA-binding protein
MNTIFVIGIFFCFFLCFLLLSKRHKSLSDKTLAIWMLVIGLHLLSYYTYSLGFWDKYPHLVGITHPFPLLHGPLLFLYVAFSLRKDQHLRFNDLLHFSPALLSYLYMIPFFFFYSAEQKVKINHNLIDDYSIFAQFSLVAFILSGIIYTFLAYRLVGKYQRLIQQNFAYEESINLKWLKYCIWGIGIIFLTVLVISIFREGLKINFSFNADMIFFVQIFLFVLFLGFYGIRQQGIFSGNNGELNQLIEPKQTSEYKKSGLKDEEAGQYHKQLLNLMKTRKPFLEPKLTLNFLAGELNVSVNHLSQIINQYESKNFYDFINEYRVEEFKHRVKDSANKNFSILAVAFDSGFNSKSSFNQVFKKHTGITPSEYMTSEKV